MYVCVCICIQTYSYPSIKRIIMISAHTHTYMYIYIYIYIFTHTYSYPSIKRIIMISAASDYGLASPLKVKRQAEDILRSQSHLSYAIVRVPNLKREAGGVCARVFIYINIYYI
jgi:hypothetical protein